MVSSTGKSNLGPRFNDYLDGLSEEFELQSNAMSATSTRPRRFHVYLEGLQCEFELMADKIESLQNERDCHRFVCEQCSMGTTPSKLQTTKTTSSLSPRPSESPDKSGTSGIGPSTDTTTRHPSQSVSHSTSKRSEPISSDSEIVTLP